MKTNHRFLDRVRWEPVLNETSETIPPFSPMRVIINPGFSNLVSANKGLVDRGGLPIWHVTKPDRVSEAHQDPYTHLISGPTPIPARAPGIGTMDFPMKVRADFDISQGSAIGAPFYRGTVGFEFNNWTLQQDLPAYRVIGIDPYSDDFVWVVPVAPARKFSLYSFDATFGALGESFQKVEIKGASEFNANRFELKEDGTLKIVPRGIYKWHFCCNAHIEDSNQELTIALALNNNVMGVAVRKTPIIQFNNPSHGQSISVQHGNEMMSQQGHFEAEEEDIVSLGAKTDGTSVVQIIYGTLSIEPAG